MAMPLPLRRRGRIAILTILPARSRQTAQGAFAGLLAQLLSRRDVLLPSLLSMVHQHATGLPLRFVPLLQRLGLRMTLSALLSQHCGGDLGIWWPLRW